MPQSNIMRPTKTYRGTWDEVLTHSDEIPKTSEVEVWVFQPKKMTARMALLQSWLDEDSTNDPEKIRAAEEDLREFKRNMNLTRKQAGARLLYPETE